MDVLLGSMDDTYHEDIWRSLRETMTGVTSASLEAAIHLFPQLVADVAQSGGEFRSPKKITLLETCSCPHLRGEMEKL